MNTTLKKKLRKTIYILISAIFYISISFFLELKSAWILFLFIFYLSVFYILKNRALEIFSQWKSSLFLAWIYMYPFINITCLYLVDINFIAYSYRFFNTLEHIFLIGSIAFVIFGIFNQTFQKLLWKEKIIILFSVLITIGVGIEILQYILRIYIFEPAPTYKLAAYYTDTIADTTTNLLAGFFWSIVLADRDIESKEKN